MIKIEHNVETGEIKEVTLSPAELKDKENEITKTNKKVAEELIETAATAAAKAALLTKLGIDENEAKLLLS